jgi:hypothetical protein
MNIKYLLLLTLATSIAAIKSPSRFLSMKAQPEKKYKIQQQNVEFIKTKILSSLKDYLLDTFQLCTRIPHLVQNYQKVWETWDKQKFENCDIAAGLGVMILQNHPFVTLPAIRAALSYANKLDNLELEKSQPLEVITIEKQSILNWTTFCIGALSFTAGGIVFSGQGD